MSNATLSFLPWVRQGAAASVNHRIRSPQSQGARHS